MIVHELEGYIQSIYLIEYPHGLLLLDGCCRADVMLIQQFIMEHLNRPLDDLKVVVVTHMHPDHAGGAHKLRNMTGCQLISANKKTQWYGGINGVLMHWVDVILTMYVAKRIGKRLKYVGYQRKLYPDMVMNDGDDIPGFGEWQVLEMPGHTDRDLSIRHKPSNQIYVADLLIKLRKNYICPFPIFHPNKYRASLQKLAELKPSCIFLAHGGQVVIDDNQINEVINKAPVTPQTPLRASIKKMRMLFGKNL